MHIFNLSTWEAETDGSLWILGQPGLQSDFSGHAGLQTETLSQKTNKQIKQKQKQNNKKKAGAMVRSCNSRSG